MQLFPRPAPQRASWKHTGSGSASCALWIEGPSRCCFRRRPEPDAAAAPAFGPSLSGWLRPDSLQVVTRRVHAKAD